MAPEFNLDTGDNSSGDNGIKGEQGSEPGTTGNATTDIGTNNGVAGDQNNASGVAAPTPKRRGRQAYPRDAEGRIIRPDGTVGTKPSPRAQAKPSLDVKRFAPNDRAKVGTQIQGLHAALATITKQPVFMLSPPEAEALTKSLCDVLDYHEISLNEAAGPWGLYATLGLVAFSIYKPRLDIIARGGGTQVEGRAQPATPGAASSINAGTIDLSADIDSHMTGQNQGRPMAETIN